MSIIRPPISGDSPQDSWANQVTEAINKGLLAPSINAATPAANINLNGISAATIYLYTRTVTATAPAAVDVDITYDYKNMKDICNIYKEELIAYVFHPTRLFKNVTEETDLDELFDYWD